MKKIFTLFLLFVGGAAEMKSQTVQLNEVFTSSWVPSSFGWYRQNSSEYPGVGLWTQGTATNMPAHSGAGPDYISTNFACESATPGVISNWLVTPTISLMNGGILEFWTRVPVNPTNFPDNMEVRYSVGTGTGAIGPLWSDLGTFTHFLTAINPSESTTGYPGTWTQYTISLSSITGTQVGRFAFRYYISDGGPNGSNSDYLGLDDVKYTTAPPCPTTQLSVTPSSATICPGGSVSLVASGGTTYSWSTSSTSSSIIVNPSSTTVYTVSAYTASTCPTVQSITVTVGPPPTVVTAQNLTICPGNGATLTASGANTYSWSNGATTSVNIVAVNGNTTYVVTGSNGPGCSDTKTISISNNTFLVISSPTVTACPNQVTTLGASGAQSYVWSNSATTPSIIITPTVNSIYSVTGNDGVCNETKYITVNLDPNMYTPSFTTCAGTAATLIATGAQTYSWSTGSTASVAVVTPSANTVYTITGTSGACSVTRTVSVTIGTNLSVLATQSCVGTSLILSAYGANSYTWLPINDFNQSVIVTPTAATIYTLMGKAGTCVGSKTFQLTYCAGIEELQLLNESIVVYPNPFNSELKISGAYGDVKVVNMMGQLIMSAKVEDTTTLKTETLEPGVYFVIITDPVSIKRKIVKVIKN